MSILKAMKLTTLTATATATAALLLFAAPALAMGCQASMKSIDVAIYAGAASTLSQDKKDEVAALRAKGEQQHQKGKHRDAFATLAEASELLGIQ